MPTEDLAADQPGTSMDGVGRPFAELYHAVHRHFIWLLLGSYAIAAVAPVLGLWIRDVSFGPVSLLQLQFKVSLPLLMLAALLFNAGLGVQASGLKNLLRRPWVLLTGLAANVGAPIAFIFLVSQGMRWWHEPDEAQNVLVGLALIASMPIAGSSTAWSQNANGNVALSLGLVLFSTLLSPFMTPLALHLVGFMAAGDYAEDLHELAGQGMGGFLGLWVVLPSCLGVAVRWIAGPDRIAKIKPHLKLINAVNLLLLNYSNAAISLPRALAEPDPDFLAISLLITVGLCILGFAAGEGVARLFRTDRADQTSLMFGLGMNNNGTGLVLASLALADHPDVMLPIIFYNLVQHLVAGGMSQGFRFSSIGFRTKWPFVAKAPHPQYLAESEP